MKFECTIELLWSLFSEYFLCLITLRIRTLIVTSWWLVQVGTHAQSNHLGFSCHFIFSRNAIQTSWSESKIWMVFVAHYKRGKSQIVYTIVVLMCCGSAGMCISVCHVVIICGSHYCGNWVKLQSPFVGLCDLMCEFFWTNQVLSV